MQIFNADLNGHQVVLNALKLQGVIALVTGIVDRLETLLGGHVTVSENGGTAEKVIFNFSNALDYVGGVNKQGMEASLVEHDEYGTVLKIEATEHIAAGYISIDYKKLMDAVGLTAVDLSDYGKVKITYLADTSYAAEGGVLKLSVLQDSVAYPTSQNSLDLTTYSKWQTQTMFFAGLTGAVDGPVNALSIYNANGALKGDAIYIASIEFLK